MCGDYRMWHLSSLRQELVWCLVLATFLISKTQSLTAATYMRGGLYWFTVTIPGWLAPRQNQNGRKAWVEEGCLSHSRQKAEKEPQEMEGDRPFQVTPQWPLPNRPCLLAECQKQCPYNLVTLKSPTSEHVRISWAAFWSKPQQPCCFRIWWLLSVCFTKNEDSIQKILVWVMEGLFTSFEQQNPFKEGDFLVLIFDITLRRAAWGWTHVEAEFHALETQKGNIPSSMVYFRKYLVAHLSTRHRQFKYCGGCINNKNELFM